MSFYSGLQFIENVGSAILQDHNYLVLKRMISGMPPNKVGVEIKNVKEQFEKKFSRHEQKIKVHGDLQKYMLLVGAVAYFLWHTLEMYFAQI